MEKEAIEEQIKIYKSKIEEMSLMIEELRGRRKRAIKRLQHFEKMMEEEPSSE